MRTRSELLAAQERNLTVYRDAGIIPAPPASSIGPGNRDWVPVVVKVKLAGGVAGDRNNDCTFTYDVWRAATPTSVLTNPTAAQTTAFRIATAKTPVERPILRGVHIAAPTASFGQAVFDYLTSAWVLLVAHAERLDTGPCGT